MTDVLPWQQQGHPKPGFMRKAHQFSVCAAQWFMPGGYCIERNEGVWGDWKQQWHCWVHLVPCWSQNTASAMSCCFGFLIINPDKEGPFKRVRGLMFRDNIQGRLWQIVTQGSCYKGYFSPIVDKCIYQHICVYYSYTNFKT